MPINARASPFTSRGPSLAGDSAQNRHAGRATDSQSSDVTRRLSAFTHAATPTAIVGLYNWFGQTYILGRLSLVTFLYFFLVLLITPMTTLLVTAFLHDKLSWKKIVRIIALSYCLTILGVFLNELCC